MSQGNRKQGRLVMPVADKLAISLKPYASQIMVVGSLRRLEPYVGDIEILAISDTEFDLIGQPMSYRVDEWVKAGFDSGLLTPGGCNGPKHKKFQVQAAGSLIYFDLYLTEPETYGIIAAIRTGCEEFSRAIVTCRSKGGLLPDVNCVKDGRLWQCDRDAHGNVLKKSDTPIDIDERGFIERVCGKWIEPQHRTKRGVAALLKTNKRS